MTYEESQAFADASFTVTGCSSEQSEPAPECSENTVSDELAADSRMEADDKTWNWGQAASEIGINESTLRKMWWEEELEPAFRYSPTPLRVVVRTVKKSGREISEFTADGIEVLKTYKGLKEKGDRHAGAFLKEAKARYPAPQKFAQLDVLPVVEGELEDFSTGLVLGSRGQITTQQAIQQAQPLLKLDIQSLQIQLPQADTTVLDADTQKLQGISEQAIAVLTEYVKADLQAKVSQLLSQNNNLASAIQTAATVGAVQGIQSPKPQVESPQSQSA